MLSLIKKLRLKAYIALFRMLPIQKNKIICWSDNLKSYGCSPKYIAEYLAKNRRGKYDIVWVFNEDAKIPDNIPDGIRVVRYFSIDYLRELHTAHIIICNCRMAPALMFKKRKGQKYIQTWHSSLRLKKIEGDTNLPEAYIESARKDSANIDLLISGCEFSTDIFRRAFWYNGEIFGCGTPRCDIFFESSTARSKMCGDLGINEKSKVLLYAPTFRKDYKANDLGLDYAALKSALEKRFSDEWTIIYRYHPNVTDNTDASQLPVWLKNGTRYSDMQILLAGCDALITDYSSCMFDAAVAGKPCFLYAPDLEDYLANERGLYFDIKSLPFDVALSNEELCEKINQFEAERYSNDIKEFLNEVGSYEDGHAAERIAERIDKM